MRNNPKQWLHYIKDIIAADLYSAVLLARYIRNAELYKLNILNVEVIDLRRSRILHNAIPAAISNNDPFVFVVGKN